MLMQNNFKQKVLHLSDKNQIKSSYIIDKHYYISFTQQLHWKNGYYKCNSDTIQVCVQIINLSNK